MSSRERRQGFGILGVGTAACAACCAGPVLGFLAAAGIGAVIGVVLFGLAGLALCAVAVVVYLRRRQTGRIQSTAVPIVLGRKTDA